jgi:hypothetical protein
MVSGQLHTANALPPGKEPSVSIRQEDGWALEPSWTMWRREKDFVHAQSELTCKRTYFYVIFLQNSVIYE